MANQVVKLKKGSDYLYPYADFMGIDTTNVIASGNLTANTPFTITQDCFFEYRFVGSGATHIFVDNMDTYIYVLGYASDLLQLKKGQTVKAVEGGVSYCIFGIKRTTN